MSCTTSRYHLGNLSILKNKNKLRHINYPNSVHNILVRTFPQHILLSLNPPIRMSSGGGAKLESFSHSPRPSRFTEGSAVLAGLILGTGLDSSLFKKMKGL